MLLPVPALAVVLAAWSVTSPDRGLAVDVDLRDSTVRYTVRANDRVVLESAPLGVTMEGASGDFTTGLAFTKKSERTVKDRFVAPTGKKHLHQTEARELTLTFANAARKPVEVIFRAYNDGVAFRYRFPGKGAARITAEATTFRLPARTTAWLQTYKNDYEGRYPKMAPSQAPPEVGFPALFATESAWVLLTEAAVYGDYDGARLEKGGEPDSFKIKLADAAVDGTLPWATPWRVAIIGGGAGYDKKDPEGVLLSPAGSAVGQSPPAHRESGLKAIVESTLVEDLNPPSEVRDTRWIKPGASTFPWWSDSRANTDQKKMRGFVDLAAAMKWSWIEFDTGLITDPHPKDWIGDDSWMKLGWPAEFVRYAKERGVHVYAWDHWKNLDTGKKRDKYFAYLRSIGIEGIKIDFMNSDSQAMFQWHDDTIRDCARYKLMVSFHGATLPRGQQRRWPHIMSWEAVMATEYYQAWGKERGPTPENNTVLPFTRNVVGPMDFAGVTFSSKKRKTTAAHELALSVVFESAWQNLADAPDMYLKSTGRPFLEGMPAAWDETRFVDGRPGEFVVLARRSGNTWYVAGISAGPARDLTLTLGFLGEKPATFTMYEDDPTGATIVAAPRTIDPARPVSLALRPNGGFAFKVLSAPAGKSP